MNDVFGSVQTWNDLHFETDNWDALYALHHRYHDDPDWPHHLKTLSDLADQISEWSIQVWLNAATVEVLVTSAGDPVGFTTLRLYDDAMQRPFVELGTFLSPPWRGTGLNGVCKRRAVAIAQNVYSAAWLVCVVPKRNLRAIFAMSKLDPPFKVLDPASDKHPLYPFFKHRVFVSNEDVQLFMLELNS